jgi:hypothetical protein
MGPMSDDDRPPEPLTLADLGAMLRPYPLDQLEDATHLLRPWPPPDDDQDQDE